MSNLEDRSLAPRVLFSAIANHDALLEAIRKRIEELNISYETLEALAGIQSGYASKFLASPPPKRVTAFTWFLVLQALGMEMQLAENPQLAEKLRERRAKKKLTKKAKGLPAGSTYKYELTPDLMRRRARMGGYARAKRLSPERLSEIGRNAINARWRRYREAQQQL
jgi:hypothetical protein